MTENRHILVVGASGVIGSAAVEHFAAKGWHVTAISRRRPVLADDCSFDHVSLDLGDNRACASAAGNLSAIDFLVYAAVSEAPGLVSGWRNEGLIEKNGQMFANILDPLSARGSLRHVSLLQGTKAYGAHNHQVEAPLREDRPRDDHSNFYWLQEDHARKRGAEAGFAFTIFRPQVLIGHAPGAAMNLAAAFGAYAAICKELHRPFAYPGAVNALWELVDTGLLAEAFDWATQADAARNQIFNVTNGDVFGPRDAWPALADAFGLRKVEPVPASLVAFFAEPRVQAAWSRLVARHGLRVAALSDLLGQSHHYADLLLGKRIAEKAAPVLLSTIKIRQAGFDSCRDSSASLIHWIDQMVELKLLPPFKNGITIVESDPHNPG